MNPEQHTQPDPVLNLVDIVTKNEEESKSIDSYMDQYDQVANEAAVQRQQLITKIADAIAGMSLDLNSGNAEAISAKLSAITAASNLINDREKSFATRVKMRQSSKAIDSVTNTGKLVTDLLLKIDMTQLPRGCNAPVSTESFDDLDKAVSEAGIEIKPTELIEDPFDFQQTTDEDVEV